MHSDTQPASCLLPLTFLLINYRVLLILSPGSFQIHFYSLRAEVLGHISAFLSLDISKIDFPPSTFILQSSSKISWVTFQKLCHTELDAQFQGHQHICKDLPLPSLSLHHMLIACLVSAHPSGLLGCLRVPDLPMPDLTCPLVPSLCWQEN
ncbi:hypothetical protein VULLAG_LOCUS5147 [Vulpes lagopus]